MAAVKGTAGEVVLQGYLKKLKTMKKKYFVIRGESTEASARLEYYDSEKKFKSRTPPKRIIPLRSCFNINRRLDTKHRCVIALYTKDDCFCVLLDAEQDLAEWLRVLLSLQRGEEAQEGEPPRPTFEHVWQVTVQKRGLGASKGILGHYHLCLTDKTLSLVRIGQLTSQVGNEANKVVEQQVEFPLMCIRRCGDSESFFYMEVGRQACTGAGELWMHTEDPNIAQNMHSTILSAMSNTTPKEQVDQLLPKSRTRSSSATESSKPLSIALQRRQTHGGGKSINFSPSSEVVAESSTTIPAAPSVTCGYTTCPPCPEDAPLQVNEVYESPLVSNVPIAVSTSCNPQYPPMGPVSLQQQPQQQQQQHVNNRPLSSTVRGILTSSASSQRRHSVSVAPVVSHQRTLSLPCTTEDVILPLRIQNQIPNTQNMQTNQQNLQNTQNIHSNMTLIHHQRTRSLPLTEETAIQINHQTLPYQNHHLNHLSYNNNHIHDNNNHELHKNVLNCQKNSTGYSSMESIVEDPQSQLVQNHKSNSSSSCSTITTMTNHPTKKLSPKSGDSPLPRRGSTGCRGAKSRTNSRSSAAGRERCDSLPSRARSTSESHQSNPPPVQRTITHRPYSMYNRGVSYSPPVACSPLSPPSGACSTDSAGSSLSIDEPDGYQHSLTPDEPGLVSRYISSLTPDSQVILEETCDDCWANDNDKTLYDTKSYTTDKMLYSNRNYEDYVNHSIRTHTSLSLPITSAGHQTGTRKGSPAPTGSVEGRGSYMDMYSPCGSSPGDHTGGPYLPMSPGMDVTRTIYSAGSGGHSRASSLAEEGHDGYVPMTPASADDGYVDMDPHHSSERGMSPAASSCSITSGTPSTDLRFSEYHLEKVTSYFTPSEEDDTSSVDRPVRAYSVGSRPELIKRKNRLEIINAESNPRVRAFSVGSRSKQRASELYNRVLNQGTPPHVHMNHINQTNGKKSSSAPLLSTSWGERGIGRPLHGSVEPMDDLMEIDFTKSPSSDDGDKNKTKTNERVGTTLPVPITSRSANEGYMDMSPKPTAPTGYVEMKPIGGENRNSSSHNISNISSPKVVSSPESCTAYMDMKPGKKITTPKNLSTSPLKPNYIASPKSSILATSPKECGPYVEMSGSADKSNHSISYMEMGRSADKVKHETPYMEMGGNADKINRNAPYMEMGRSSEKSIHDAPHMEMGRSSEKSIHDDPYMEMGRSADKLKNESPYMAMGRSADKLSRDAPYMEMGGCIDKLKDEAPYMEMGCSDDKLNRDAPYMEMGGSADKHNGGSFNSKLVSSLDKNTPIVLDKLSSSGSSKTPTPKSTPKSQEDYINMSPGRSQPVDLPQRKATPEGYVEMSWNGRRNKSKSEEYMNISYEGKSRKDRGSRSSADSRYATQPITIQSSQNVRKVESTSKPPPAYLPLTTSTSSSSSPSRKKQGGPAPKEGVVTPSGSQATIFPFSPSSPNKPFSPSSAPSAGCCLHSRRKCPVDATSGTVKLENIFEQAKPEVKILNTDFGASTKTEDCTFKENKAESSNDSDYVNYNPAPTQPRWTTNRRISDPSGDYAVMNVSRKLSSTYLGKPISVESSTTRKPVLVTITNQSQPTSASFKPIPAESEPRKSGSPRPVGSVLNRQLSERRAESGYEVLARGAAENLQVRSTENVSQSMALSKTLIPRPSSVNSEKMTAKVINPRPSSANSDRLPILNAKNRPQSVSSEVPSRPASVASDQPSTSRPSSVGGELHYASLDLPPCSNEEPERSPRPIMAQTSVTESSSGTPSPNLQALQEPAFTYAQIDFIKSENLKPPAAKIKH